MAYFNGLPSGNNKCIGSYSNESTGKLYSFIYNSIGNHTINEYDSYTGYISIVLQGSYLNFQEFQYINGVGMIDGKLLYWTDGFNPPRGIDVEKAKTGEFYTDSNSISLAKSPPLNIISCSYKNDVSTSTAQNKLKRQLFQFKYRYIYFDNSISTWSSSSTVPLPVLENESGVESYKNNHIDITFNVGNKYVTSIEIAAQVKGVSLSTGTQDWFSIFNMTRADIMSSTKLVYNSSTNTATFSFYNEGLYQSIDLNESDLSYDYVPLKSKALEIVNGNVLVLGNNTEGYDNIETNVNLNVTYETAGSTANSFGALFIPYVSPDPIFFGLPDIGDVINYSWSGLDAGIGSASYTVTSTTNGDLLATAIKVQEAITTSTSGYIVFPTPPSLDTVYGLVTIFPESSNANNNVLTALSVTNAPSIVTDSIYSWKTNSSYQFGLVYYDEFNRSTYVQTNNNYVITTKSFGSTGFQVPVISWTINHLAPSWAKKYQWVRTENLTHKTFLFWVASTALPNPSNAAYLDLDISSLNTFNTNNPNSILFYEFTPGDRCTIHSDLTGGVTGYDVPVIGYDTENGILTIEKKTSLTYGSNGLIIEIYTPKIRSNSDREQFFYEFGEVYDVIDGKYHAGNIRTQTSSASAAGEFFHGDIYFKTRNIPVTGSVRIEDPNFSDYYISNYSSNGRVNVFAPQAKQLTLPTDIRFSDVYVPNTNINGLNRFYGDAFETYDRVNGSIQKLSVRDNYLVTFQELKTGYIPINQSIIEDQGSGNEANVAISLKLLNKIRYFAGDYGIGLNPESMARFGGVMYFIDPNRNVVLKLSSGLEPISTIGMDSYFTKTLSDVRSLSNIKLLGSYDPRNDEYIITINRNNSSSETVAFNEYINRWTSFYSFIPEYANYIFNKYMTFKDGVMYEHNTNDIYNLFYGVQYPSKINLIYNASPLLIKTFIGLMEQSNSVWFAPEILTSFNNQKSNLISTDFSEKEGVLFASLFRDENSPGGLLQGDDLKGNWIKFKLQNNYTSKINTLSINSRAIPSYQGIK